MLFFLDESWQSTTDGRYKVGVLSAVQMKDHDFNECSNQIHLFKVKHLGIDAGNIEIKGHHIFREYLFDKLEARGITSRELSLARDIFSYVQTKGMRLFASVVFSEEEVDLVCADVNKLERPFFFLFERIDLFMKENCPDHRAKLIFDDRGLQNNIMLSKSVSNFLHKSHTGQTFDNIIKVPFFAISTENVGIQIADMTAYLLGSKYTGNKKRKEFFEQIKKSEFRSQQSFPDSEGRIFFLNGFKKVSEGTKEKEAGSLFGPGRTE